VPATREPAAGERLGHASCRPLLACGRQRAHPH